MPTKTIKIAHFSDIHGHLEILKDNIPDDVDLVVSTGDICPNLTRGNIDVEQRFQTCWLDDNYDEFSEYLKGKPIICVQGNHDFVCLAQFLRSKGYSAKGYSAKRVQSGVPIDILGVRFAGFPGIPYIQGEWWGEFTQNELARFVHETMDLKPDVLLTHATPQGILHEDFYDGIHALTNAILYGGFEPSYHLMGHSHAFGAQICTLDGFKTRFINGACNCLVHELAFPDPTETIV